MTPEWTRCGCPRRLRDHPAPLEPLRRESGPSSQGARGLLGRHGALCVGLPFSRSDMSLCAVLQELPREGVCVLDSLWAALAGQPLIIPAKGPERAEALFP